MLDACHLAEPHIPHTFGLVRETLDFDVEDDLLSKSICKKHCAAVRYETSTSSGMHYPASLHLPHTFVLSREMIDDDFKPNLLSTSN